MIWRVVRNSILVGMLVGCAASLPADLPSIDTQYCDPYQQTDCIAVSAGVLRMMTREAEENERLKAALNFCQKQAL